VGAAASRAWAARRAWTRHGPRGARAAHTLAHGARVAANFSYRVLEATARGWAWYGRSCHPGRSSWSRLRPTRRSRTRLRRTRPPRRRRPTPGPRARARSRAAVRGRLAVPAPPPTAGPPLPPLPPPPPPLPAATVVRRPLAPLFDARARRRAKIRLVASVDGGTDFTLVNGGTFGAYVGMRLNEVFELGGGLRLIASPENPEVAGSPVRASPIAFGRILAHFDVDSARRVALPIGVDAGGGDARAHVRLVLGIRVRIVDTLSLGLYPSTRPTRSSPTRAASATTSAGGASPPRSRSCTRTDACTPAAAATAPLPRLRGSVVSCVRYRTRRHRPRPRPQA